MFGIEALKEQIEELKYSIEELKSKVLYFIDNQVLFSELKDQFDHTIEIMGENIEDKIKSKEIVKKLDELIKFNKEHSEKSCSEEKKKKK